MSYGSLDGSGSLKGMMNHVWVVFMVFYMSHVNVESKWLSKSFAGCPLNWIWAKDQGCQYGILSDGDGLANIDSKFEFGIRISKVILDFSKYW